MEDHQLVQQDTAFDTLDSMPFRLEQQNGGARGSFQPVTAAWPQRVGARLVRALRRQMLAAAGGVALGLCIGATFPFLGPISWAQALTGGLALGVTFGAIAAAGREFGRNAIGLSSFSHGKYAIAGAAPELSRERLRQAPPDRRNPLGCLLLQPASPFATAFRQFEHDLGGTRLVAFAGPSRENGATTAALCTAISAAQRGRRVIAVDCDIHRRALTLAVGAEPERDVLFAAENPLRWREALTQEPETGLDVLPAAPTTTLWRSLFEAEGFPALLEQLRLHYDLIVLDCPPALSADGAMIAKRADKCFLVATWDETPMGALNDSLRALGRMEPASASVLLNRVPTRYQLARA